MMGCSNNNNKIFDSSLTGDSFLITLRDANTSLQLLAVVRNETPMVWQLPT
jgi:hypothetical protein